MPDVLIPAQWIAYVAIVAVTGLFPLWHMAIVPWLLRRRPVLMAVAGDPPMKEVDVALAKVCLSQMLDEAKEGEAFAVTRNGKREGVLVTYAQWARISRVPSPGWMLARSPAGSAAFDGRGKGAWSPGVRANI